MVRRSQPFPSRSSWRRGTTKPGTPIVEPSPVDNLPPVPGKVFDGATIRPMTSKAFSVDAIAEHIERVVTRDQRGRHSVWFIVWDRSAPDRIVHFPIDEIPPSPTEEECRYVAGFFTDTIAQMGLATGVVFLITRPGATAVSSIDRRWYRAVHAASAENLVPLLGVHLLTPYGGRQLVLDDVI